MTQTTFQKTSGIGSQTRAPKSSQNATRLGDCNALQKDLTANHELTRMANKPET